MKQFAVIPSFFLQPSVLGTRIQSSRRFHWAAAGPDADLLTCRRTCFLPSSTCTTCAWRCHPHHILSSTLPRMRAARERCQQLLGLSTMGPRPLAAAGTQACSPGKVFSPARYVTDDLRHAPSEDCSSSFQCGCILSVELCKDFVPSSRNFYDSFVCI